MRFDQIKIVIPQYGRWVLYQNLVHVFVGDIHLIFLRQCGNHLKEKVNKGKVSFLFITYFPIVVVFDDVAVVKIIFIMERALLNKSELVTTVPHRVDCYVMRILFGIPNSVIRLSALTIA
ncbi:hypothetical protein, partial [Symbiopectobacterium sp.]|uniref:hypothetical protein n=1 Tax=Symbiopectobacterium sp. TaxID=2952789 RepID=UPI003F38DFE9